MLTSITFYILIYVSSFSTAYCYSKTKDKEASVVFLILTFMILFLPAALRYGVGTDYKNYVRIISRGLARDRYNMFEPGWIPIFKFMKKFNVDIQWWFAATSFFTLLFIFLSIDKEDFWIAVPLYMTLGYIEMQNITRQALAASLCMYAIKLWFKRKYIKAILFTGLACLFHKSAVLYFAVLPFVNQDWKFFGRYKNFILYLVLFIVIIKLNIGKIFMERFAGQTFYAVYLKSRFNNVSELKSGLHVMLNCFIFLLVLLFTSRTGYSKYGCQQKVIVKNQLYQAANILAFVMFLFQLLWCQIIILGRLLELFYPAYILIIPAIYHSKSKYRKWIVLGILLLRLVAIVPTLYSNNSLPYRTIFNKY